jgi:hypothetical protein
MSNVIRKNWTEGDVNALIGRSESIRLEFKSLADPSDQKWVEEVSKQVSAFANTEGGELILGVREERKGNTRIATAIEGVPTTLARERLQQVVESNVSPDLTGVRVQVIRISGISERVVFVIQIPQGSTAYQAHDGRYYGRSEFEVKYLRDRDIRLRMNRGKITLAAVYPRIKNVVLATDYEKNLKTKHAAGIEAFKKDPADAFKRFPDLWEMIGAGVSPDEIRLHFVMRNDGELTIRDPAVELHDVRAPGIFDGLTVEGGRLNSRHEMRHDLIYPGDEREIADSECRVQCRRESALASGDYVVNWKVYLDDSAPSEGEIDLGDWIQNARDRAALRQPNSNSPAQP